MPKKVIDDEDKNIGFMIKLFFPFNEVILQDPNQPTSTPLQEKPHCHPNTKHPSV